MTKSEMNKAWAELEQHSLVVDNDGKAVYRDYTEPNRFFAEVVPRMEELGFSTEHESEGYYIFSFVYYFEETGQIQKFPGDSADIGEAGLEAAIKARKEIGR